MEDKFLNSLTSLKNSINEMLQQYPLIKDSFDAPKETGFQIHIVSTPKVEVHSDERSHEVVSTGEMEHMLIFRMGIKPQNMDSLKELINSTILDKSLPLRFNGFSFSEEDKVVCADISAKKVKGYAKGFTQSEDQPSTRITAFLERFESDVKQGWRGLIDALKKGRQL